MARVPGFFRCFVALEIGGVDETQPSQSLEPSEFGSKKSKTPTEKDTGPGPKIFQESRFCQPPREKKKMRIHPHLSAMVFWSAPLPLLRPLHFYSSSVGASQGTVR